MLFLAVEINQWARSEMRQLFFSEWTFDTLGEHQCRACKSARISRWMDTEWKANLDDMLGKQDAQYSMPLLDNVVSS